MKVTFITGYFDPEQTADVHLNHDLAYGLAELGAEVTVVTPFPNRGLTKEKQMDYINRSDEAVSDRLRIIRAGEPSEYKQNIAGRGIFLLKRTRQLFKRAKQIEGTDVFLITSTPPFLGYVAAMLSKKAPVVYKLQDVFPDSLSFTGGISEKSLAFTVLKKLEKAVYKRCSLIVSDSEDIKKTISDGRVSENKVDVVLDWIDEDSCVPVCKENNPLFDEYNVPRDSFCVCYAGNIGPLQNTRLIVDAAKQIENLGIKDIVFVILGDGSYRRQLDDYVAEYGCKNLIRIPMQPLERVSFVYSLGDADLVTLIPGMTRIALPSKIWSVMSAGRPCICSFDKDSSLRRIVEENHCGICSDASDVDGLVNAVLSLYSDRGMTAEMGRNARLFVEKNMTKNIAVSKYYSIIENLNLGGL